MCLFFHIYTTYKVSRDVARNFERGVEVELPKVVSNGERKPVVGEKFFYLIFLVIPKFSILMYKIYYQSTKRRGVGFGEGCPLP